MIDAKKHQVDSENAAKFKEWLETRGGLAIWQSVDLSDPCTWTTPVIGSDGTPHGPPHPWKCGPNATPIRIIKDINEVEVCVNRVVKKFHVAVRMGGNGMSLKVTDGGSRRIRKEVEKAGTGAFYEFDYGSHDNCIILAPEKVIPLAEWKESNEPA